LALAGLATAGVASGFMLSWPAQPVFLDTYAVDPFAVYFKLFAVGATAVVLLATHSHFRGRPHAAEVPSLLVLACLGMVGLSASQDLALIALFIQLITVPSYILAGIAKDDRRATEGALKLFLFSAAATTVMLYGMSLLYGLTGTLLLPELAARLPHTSALAAMVALSLVLAGYGFKITLVPFHTWAPDTYEGSPTPISGYLSVGPKAAGFTVLLRTLLIAFPDNTAGWQETITILAALTMTVGNLFALRQTSAKRLLAYSSIAQAGYLLVGVAAAANEPLAVSGLLLYLLVYLFMNLGAFLAVEDIEREIEQTK
jgi:NADH-quinone oxidoreductase subunit N